MGGTLGGRRQTGHSRRVSTVSTSMVGEVEVITERGYVLIIIVLMLLDITLN